MLQEKRFKSSAHDVDAYPLHKPKVSALDEHQHQGKCSGFESFLEQQDLRMYWLNLYTNENEIIC